LELLERLKQRDGRCDRVFRASEHRYRLGPRLSIETVSAFEREHAITLPAEYRDFLLYAGNGGAGPDYGLVPLHDAVPRDDAPAYRELLSQPFPYTVQLTPEEFAPLGDDDPLWDEFFSDRLIRGCLRLAHNGCNNWDLIVVNGPAHGTVWSDCRGSCQGLVPQEKGFYEWYRDWLEQSLDTARLI
jgi:hypothetical protein